MSVMLESPFETPVLLTMSETAGILGISRSTVKRLIDRGELGYYPKGKCFYRFDKAEVLECRRRREQSQQSEI